MSKYKMIYDGGDFVDGVEYDDFENAKADALDTLINWMGEEACSPKYKYLTPEESWNMMIEECITYVQEYNENTKDFEDCWYPEDKDLIAIGWVEIKKQEEEI